MTKLPVVIVGITPRREAPGAETCPIYVRSVPILCIIPVGGVYRFRAGCGVGCCLPEGCVRLTFPQLPMTTSSVFLPGRAALRVSALHPRRGSRIPSEGGRSDTPLLPPSSPFYSLGFFALLPPPFPPGRCPRAGETGRTPRTRLTEGNIPGKKKGRKGVIIPTNPPPPRLAQSLSGAPDIPQQHFPRFVGGDLNLPNFLDSYFTASLLYARARVLRASRSVNSSLSASSAVQTRLGQDLQKETLKKKKKEHEMKRK